MLQEPKFQFIELKKRHILNMLLFYLKLESILFTLPCKMFECISHVYLHIIFIIHFLDFKYSCMFWNHYMLCTEGSSCMMAVWVMGKSQRRNVRVPVSGLPANGGPLPIPTGRPSVSKVTSVHAHSEFYYPPFYFHIRSKTAILRELAFMNGAPSHVI